MHVGKGSAEVTWGLNKSTKGQGSRGYNKGSARVHHANVSNGGSIEFYEGFEIFPA